MQVQWGVAPGAPVQGLIGIAAARAKSGESIMSNDVRFSAGVDWATETHQVCIVEAQGGKIIGERAFRTAAKASQSCAIGWCRRAATRRR